MKLFVLLLVFPLFHSLSMAAPTEEPYCYNLATAFINKWQDAADVPTPDLAKQIAEDCRVPLVIGFVNIRPGFSRNAWRKTTRKMERLPTPMWGF